MESEEEERISKAGDAVEEGEEVYHDAVEEEGNTEENLEEEEKEEKTETRNEKEEVNADEEEDRNKKKEVGESAKPRKLAYVGLMKPTLKEIRENPVWLRLVKKYTGKKRRGEGNRSSRANQEDVGSRTERDKVLNEYPGTDSISVPVPGPTAPMTSRGQTTEIRIRQEVPVSVWR